MQSPSSRVRQQILNAARKVFAQRGYSGASTQEIVRRAKVTKPALYYYFGSKAGLYKAVVDFAHDERFRMIQEAVDGRATLHGQLVEMLRRLCRFSKENRDLARLVFSTIFATEGEIPNRNACLKKGQRNFEFIRSLVQRGVASGEIRSKFSCEELTVAIISRILFCSMMETIQHFKGFSKLTPDRIVQLFYEGAEG